MTANVVTAYPLPHDLALSDFDNPTWNLIQPITIHQRWSGEEAPASQHAEARIVWSAESLAVRFVCNQSVPPLVNPNANLDRKTIGLWHTDVCEIFVAPDATAPNRYFEFEAAPNGGWLDLALHLQPAGRQTDWDFQSGMTTESRLVDSELTIGIRIPWSDGIPRPNDGDEWRVNLFRCVGVGNERYLAWQPTYTKEPDFHVPDVFGWLRFG
jgi:hypothetical protein